MIIIPAIDLKDGKCVRLLQGKKDEVTVYSDDPPSMARHFVIVFAHLSNNWVLCEVCILNIFYFKHIKAIKLSISIITFTTPCKSWGKNRKLIE